MRRIRANTKSLLADLQHGALKTKDSAADRPGVTPGKTLTGGRAETVVHAALRLSCRNKTCAEHFRGSRMSVACVSELHAWENDTEKVR